MAAVGPARLRDGRGCRDDPAARAAPQVAAARGVSGTTAVAVPEATAFTCAYTRQNGRWYAGNSETRTQQLVVDMTGPAVAELQCLLQRDGITPGDRRELRAPDRVRGDPGAEEVPPGRGRTGGAVDLGRPARMSGARPEFVLLATELRVLRERAALSITELVSKSAYSRSSWHRYLGGTVLPPWLAVRALCQLADEPTPRIRALWELAEAAASGRAAVREAPVTAAPTEPTGPADTAVAPVQQPAAETRPAARQREQHRWSVRALAFTCVLALCVALALAAAWQRDRAPEAVSPGAATPSVSGFHVGCVVSACTGRDPGVTLCGVQPQTLLHRLTPSGAGLEVRYNPLCRAVWARVWNTRLGDTLSLSEPGQPTQSIAVHSTHQLNAFVYTPCSASAQAAHPDRVPVGDPAHPCHLLPPHRALKNRQVAPLFTLPANAPQARRARAHPPGNRPRTVPPNRHITVYPRRSEPVPSRHPTRSPPAVDTGRTGAQRSPAALLPLRQDSNAASPSGPHLAHRIQTSRIGTCHGPV